MGAAFVVLIASGFNVARLLLHFEVLKGASHARPWTKREMARRRKDRGWIWLDTVNEKPSVGLILKFKPEGEEEA